MLNACWNNRCLFALSRTVLRLLTHHASINLLSFKVIFLWTERVFYIVTSSSTFQIFLLEYEYLSNFCLEYEYSKLYEYIFFTSMSTSIFFYNLQVTQRKIMNQTCNSKWDYMRKRSPKFSVNVYILIILENWPE